MHQYICKATMQPDSASLPQFQQPASTATSGQQVSQTAATTMQPPLVVSDSLPEYQQQPAQAGDIDDRVNRERSTDGEVPPAKRRRVDNTQHASGASVRLVFAVLVVYVCLSWRLYVCDTRSACYRFHYSTLTVSACVLFC